MRKLEDILAEQNRPDDRDLRSRTDAKNEEKRREQALSRLAEQLVELSPGALEKLELPEEVRERVLEAHRITSATARKRQLRLVRRLLRAQDADDVLRRVEALSRPTKRERPQDPGERAAAQWVARLLEEGDAALAELAASYPALERQRLRHLARRARSAADGRGKDAAEKALLAAVREALASCRSD